METSSGDPKTPMKKIYIYDAQRKVNTNQWISISLLFNEVFKQRLINCGINQNLKQLIVCLDVILWKQNECH